MCQLVCLCRDMRVLIKLNLIMAVLDWQKTLQTSICLADMRTGFFPSPYCEIRDGSLFCLFSLGIVQGFNTCIPPHS